MPWQAFVCGLLIVFIPYFFWTDPTDFLGLAHFLASVIFAFGLYLRLGALRSLRKPRTRPEPTHFETPVYTVMIALYREAAVATQLVRSMSKLAWPAERLEVFYLCEADDRDTIEALHNISMPPNHRIIEVPPGLPRTKPKALNYGLQFASGAFVVIYDAEDRPHPYQLREAFAGFAAGGPRLACLQAPLIVTNAANGWLSRMFAFEYLVHFRGLLPHLAQERLPLPLGGTSNHFRRQILNLVGGWDPYNVTEDADLGIRLARFGYRCGVLTCGTLEDGPELWKEWLPQRTRWQKGWMVTALVQSAQYRRVFPFGRHVREAGLFRRPYRRIYPVAVAVSARHCIVPVRHHPNRPVFPAHGLCLTCCCSHSASLPTLCSALPATGRFQEQKNSSCFPACLPIGC